MEKFDVVFTKRDGSKFDDCIWADSFETAKFILLRAVDTNPVTNAVIVAGGKVVYTVTK